MKILEGEKKMIRACYDGLIQAGHVLARRASNYCKKSLIYQAIASRVLSYVPLLGISANWAYYYRLLSDRISRLSSTPRPSRCIEGLIAHYTQHAGYGTLGVCATSLAVLFFFLSSFVYFLQIL
jgi:hypothetical protein